MADRPADLAMGGIKHIVARLDLGGRPSEAEILRESDPADRGDGRGRDEYPVTYLVVLPLS